MKFEIKPPKLSLSALRFGATWFGFCFAFIWAASVFNVLRIGPFVGAGVASAALSFLIGIALSCADKFLP